MPVSRMVSLDTQGLPYSWQANEVPATPYDASQPPGPKGLPQHVQINFGVTDPSQQQPGDPIMYIIPVTRLRATLGRAPVIPPSQHHHQGLLMDGGAAEPAAHLRAACPAS